MAMEVITPEGFRFDGRRVNEPRGIQCCVGGCGREADGYAVFELGSTKAARVEGKSGANRAYVEVPEGFFAPLYDMALQGCHAIAEQMRRPRNPDIQRSLKAFLSFNSSGWAPHGFIWGAQQPAHPEPPRPGKTLVIFHRGHGRGDDCPTFGDNDGTTDWLNQLGLDVVTMMMPFRDCNTQQEQPFSGHAWFEHFEKQQVPWLRFFLEPVIKTINYAMNTLGYERILMAGLSGGGWTTTLAAAVDPRIELSVPIAGSLPCDFRKKSFDFEQFCDSQWARIGNYTALYVLASLEKHRSSLQVLHEADPCCFHGCGRHNRIEEYGRFVRASSQGLFQTVVTEGNRHEVNVRDKILIGNLFYQMAHGHHGQLNLSSPLNLLERSSISGFTEPDEIPGEAVCEQHRWTSVSHEGYHCHDTFLYPVPSPDLGAFYLVWRRSWSEAAGSYRAHLKSIGSKEFRTGRSVYEDAIMDATDGKLTLVRRPEEAGRGPTVLALVKGEAIVNVVSARNGPTVEIVHLTDGGNHRRVLWRQSEATELCAAFEGQLRIQQMLFVQEMVYLLAKRCADDGGHKDSDKTGVILQGVLDSWPAVLRQMFTVSADTLQRSEVPLPPWDFEGLPHDVGAGGLPSKLYEPSGAVSGERLDEPAAQDVICHAPLTIDGFSDSFSVSVVGYDVQQDVIFILDAGDQLWRDAPGTSARGGRHPDGSLAHEMDTSWFISGRATEPERCQRATPAHGTGGHPRQRYRKGSKKASTALAASLSRLWLYLLEVSFQDGAA
eukprot:g26948.t1